MLHGKYSEVAVIIPGYAKSAGTIIAMAGDEILMDSISALGPIDAHLQW
jgi:ClpP class serine protease